MFVYAYKNAQVYVIVYVIIGAASLYHMHVSSSENYNMLSKATGSGCPNC